MKFLCISDTHGSHNLLELSKYDFEGIIFAGDWTQGKDLLFKETIPFLEWLEDIECEHKLLVAGNHEVSVQNMNEEFYELLKEYPSITYLQDTEVVINGVKFYGSPYSNEFFNWAFMEEDYDLKTIWDKIPDDTNVLITHGPAYGIHDLVKRSYNRDPHVGSKALHYRKLAIQDHLKFHISGHIHEHGNCIEVKGNVTNVCPCIRDENYRVANEPIIIEI